MSSPVRTTPTRSYSAPARSTYVAPRPVARSSVVAPRVVPLRSLTGAAMTAPLVAGTVARRESYRMVCKSARGQYSVQYETRPRTFVTRTDRDTIRLEIVRVDRRNGAPYVIGRNASGQMVAATFGRPRDMTIGTGRRERRDDCY